MGSRGSKGGEAPPRLVLAKKEGSDGSTYSGLPRSSVLAWIRRSGLLISGNL
jgi:hypothetical protein